MIEIYAPESAAARDNPPYPRRRKLPGEIKRGEVCPPEQEWAYRVVLIPNREWLAKYGRRKILTADDVAPLFENLTHLAHEEFWVLALDARHQIVATSRVAQGSLASCPVLPADFFRAALLFHAVAVVAVHNHPTGDVTPSNEDDDLTDHLIDGARILGLRLLDHIIVGRDRGTGVPAMFSFQGAGRIR